MKRPYYGAPRTNLEDQLSYKEHLKVLKKPTKKVDNLAPHLPANTYIKLGHLDSGCRRLHDLEQENRAIVRALNIVGRTSGKIDNKQSDLTKLTNFRERQLRNIEIEANNKELFKGIESAQSRYRKDGFMKEYQELTAKCKSLAIPEKQRPEETWSLAPDYLEPNRQDPSKRIRCYFDLSLEMKQPIGRLIMEIWMDIAPVTGCNFLNLCKSYGGYSYKHTPFHRIVKGLFFIGGDVVNKSGTGIYSVYGGVNSTFGDENAILEFNGPGVIAAHTVFAGDNHSQFLITFTKLTSMNKNFIVFGRAVGGQRVLDIIEGYGTKGGRPLKDIYITDCGILGGTKVPKPSTMRLPLKISPASSEEKFSLQTVYDPQYKQVIDPYKSNALIREQLIKKARKELKHMKMPIYKLSMDPIDSTANIDCVKAFAKRNKKNERNL